jgi:aspartyl-tRNA(Asn)/glutamyl-tRNA(Gln) amidotransferase subunit B
MQFEIERQTKVLNTGEYPIQETRGTRDMSGKTHSQRIKEEADDYRYFPEPDIPPLHFSSEYLEELRAGLPKLPAELIAEYEKLGVAREHAEMIVTEKVKSDLLSQIISGGCDRELVVEVAKSMVSDLANLQADTNTDWNELIPDLAAYLEILTLRKQGKINSNTAKELTKLLINRDLIGIKAIHKYIEANSLLIKGDASDIIEIAKKLILADASAKERYQKNPNTAMHFVGQLMKETKGSANPQLAKEIVVKILTE